MEHGNTVRAGKIVYDRKNASFNTLKVEDVDWDLLFEGVHWVHWSGITPALSENAAQLCNKMVHEAYSRQIPVSCDLHFRANLWDYGKRPAEVILPLLEQTSHLVGDPYTIAETTGLSTEKNGNHLSDEEITAFFSKVKGRFSGLKSISMLSRRIIHASDNFLKGILYTENEHHSKEYHIPHIVDRIGGGDAFMAGLIYGLLKNHSAEKIIENATALAAYKHTIPGDRLEGTLEDFQTLTEESTRGKIKR